MADILHTLYIHKPSKDVFKAISLGEEFSNWWTKMSSGHPVLHAKYRFYFSPEYDWTATIVEYVEDSEIAFQFVEADNDWLGTVMAFKLYFAEGTTRTAFSHTGWSATNEHFRRSSYCWAMYLNLMKIYVESGQISAFEDRDFT